MHRTPSRRRQVDASSLRRRIVFLPVIRGSFYAPILRGLYTVLRARGRHMVVAFGQTIANEREEAMAGAEFLIEHGCDGLIIMSTALKLKDVENLITMQPRLAVLSKSFARYADICFAPDYEAAGPLAARTLLEAGHREIAVIENPTISADNIQPMSGFFLKNSPAMASISKRSRASAATSCPPPVRSASRRC